MKICLMAASLAVFTSSALAASEEITKRDLMIHYVSELESNYIGQPVDYYDIDAVNDAIRGHQIYLTLCSNKMASNSCEQAAQDLSQLNSTLETHYEFQNDLVSMWKINGELNQRSSPKVGDPFKNFWD
ncbi:hypothetical protein [Vibrio mediterranei]|uniref:hypothetical protein n=1 Tax=Vibrio mediterranei TaxID=689 RepID=UPI004067E0C8